MVLVVVGVVGVWCAVVRIRRGRGRARGSWSGRRAAIVLLHDSERTDVVSVLIRGRSEEHLFVGPAMAAALRHGERACVGFCFFGRRGDQLSIKYEMVFCSFHPVTGMKRRKAPCLLPGASSKLL